MGCWHRCLVEHLLPFLSSCLISELNKCGPLLGSVEKISGYRSILSNFSKFSYCISGKGCCQKKSNMCDHQTPVIWSCYINPWIIYHNVLTLGEKTGLFFRSCGILLGTPGWSFIMFIWNACSKLMNLFENFIAVSSWIIIYVWAFGFLDILPFKSFVFFLISASPKGNDISLGVNRFISLPF